MFDKMKQLMELQKKAKDVQKSLDSIHGEKKSREVKITVSMNGNHKVENLILDESLLEPSQKAFLEKALTQVISEAGEEVRQKSMS